MKESKIITFRLEEGLLEQLDAFTKTHSYWKRTFVLVAIINAFFKYASAGTRFAIVRAMLSTKKKYELKFEEITDKED